MHSDNLISDPEATVMPGDSILLPGSPGYELQRTDNPEFGWELHRSNSDGLVSSHNNFEGLVDSWKELTEEVGLTLHLAGQNIYALRVPRT